MCVTDLVERRKTLISVLAGELKAVMSRSLSALPVLPSSPTHTHTHRERERERGREGGREREREGEREGGREGGGREGESSSVLEILHVY